jgi:NAD(P)-dependent dehydrogenase (short-subunit alcohol dehydrogenase family)
VVERAAEELGTLAILVNNAGPFGLGALLDTSPARFQQLVNSNFISAFACARAAIPHMHRRGGGVIVNVGLSPTSGCLRGAAHVAPYAIAKQAVATFTRSLATELAAHDIRVVCVAPGLIDNGHLPEAQRCWMARRCPAGRLGSATEVAEVAAFLCSRAASYVSGAVVDVAGGWDWTADRAPYHETEEIVSLFKETAG